ncbi:hypothetical protein M8C21_028123 [Ambrosia artemisiifolia]|uniref:Uncharacterized protein n=1 Tax=Ambrosia artemisiifolia TaxID=4212 RepID=A0AAD5C7D7_AMBAR|nr:hypothetical protein M8C21_028123 [Ambrosia artemisiifolia]
MANPSTSLSFDSNHITTTVSDYRHGPPEHSMAVSGHNRSSCSHSPPPTTTHFDQPKTSYDDKPIKEVDFFMDKERDLSKSLESYAPTTDFDLNINTSLHLLTGNTTMDQSEQKRTKHQVYILLKS